ncbi:hypothetical protein [Metasolibacillus sp.]|uniref:hypothetical protein n=1 Tax=Metasolibacillus sp. TaxID=2703680 RepID=UPI0025F688BE|nr:hypothetical protein [Metasolibacillus sp.]MCT6925403.1 hypothetical protein [Metasolibacillus sp.]MCT6941570.1 hypothetical protein [Metasolibacillus sp.]
MASKATIMRDEGVKIKLKEKEFEVKFDLNALCDLQEKFGDFDTAFNNLDKDFSKIRTLLHIALANGENEKMTEREIGALIDMQNLFMITEALEKAFNNAMPSTDEVEGK